jgi:hypothetical protein
MPLDLAALRPAYNGTALATALTIPGHLWAAVLTAAATQEAPGAAIGLTAAAGLGVWLLDRTRYRDADGHRHPWWVPRVAVWTVAVAGPAYCVAAHPAMLSIITGAHL